MNPFKSNRRTDEESQGKGKNDIVSNVTLRPETTWVCLVATLLFVQFARSRCMIILFVTNEFEIDDSANCDSAKVISKLYQWERSIEIRGNSLEC